MNPTTAATSSGLFVSTIYNQSRLADKSTWHAIGLSALR